MRLRHCRNRTLIVCWIAVTTATTVGGRQCLAGAASPHASVTIDEVITSTQATTLRPFNDVSDRLISQNKYLVLELLKVMKEPRSSNLARCFAAYYLGEVRDPE